MWQFILLQYIVTICGRSISGPRSGRQKQGDGEKVGTEGWWLRRGGEADSRWSQAEWGVRVPGEADWWQRCGRLGRDEGRELMRERNNHWGRWAKQSDNHWWKSEETRQSVSPGDHECIMSIQETTPSDPTAPLNHTQAPQNAHRAQ